MALYTIINSFYEKAVESSTDDTHDHCVCCFATIPDWDYPLDAETFWSVSDSPRDDYLKLPPSTYGLELDSGR